MLVCICVIVVTALMPAWCLLCCLICLCCLLAVQSAQQLSCSTVSSQLRDQTDCFRPGQFKVYSSAVRGTLIMDTVSSISLSLKMQYFQKSYFTSAAFGRPLWSEGVYQACEREKISQPGQGHRDEGKTVPVGGERSPIEYDLSSFWFYWFSGKNGEIKIQDMKKWRYWTFVKVVFGRALILRTKAWDRNFVGYD